ncbi:hypothetical protein KAH81_09675 [bacterium]|nr:hypothetical protein [bacterium]
MGFRFFLTRIIVFLSIGISLAQELPPQVGEAKKLFSFAQDKSIIDFAVDNSLRLYVLSENEDSIEVSVYDTTGKLLSKIPKYKGAISGSDALHLQVSNDGDIIVVWGINLEFDMPVNWIFTAEGNEVLSEDNLLKYAEWLQVSPSGKFFTCQGYKGTSGISAIYDIDWIPLEWESKSVKHGYFVGKRDDEDLLLFTESDSLETSLALIKLQSREVLFSEQLSRKESSIMPYRSRIAFSERLFVMNYSVELGEDILGFDALTGQLSWIADCPIKAYDFAFSDREGFLVAYGGSSIVIYDDKGKELVFSQVGKDGFAVFGHGIPDFCFFEDQRLAVANFSQPGGRTHSVILSFDEDWNSRGADIINANFEGFSNPLGEFIAFNINGEVGLYRLMSK